MSARAKFLSYSRCVFRIFATIETSQHLMDDLVSSARAQKRLARLYYSDPNAAAQQSPIERVLQKSQRQQIIETEIAAKFTPQNWYSSRYSDGSWSVLYTAESEDTAINEALYHMKRFYAEEVKQKDVLLDRKQVCLKLQTKFCVEVLILKNIKKKELISQDDSGYDYCQKLAKKLIEQGAQLLKVPSARHKEHFCIPVFDKAAIKKDFGHLKYLKCLLKKDGSVAVYRAS